MTSPLNRQKRQGITAMIILLLSASSLIAGPKGKHYGYSTEQAIGLRLGWSGAPNGLSYRKVFAPNQAFEVIAGYNHKEGRTLNVPIYKKGSSFAEFRYVPFSMKSSYSSNLAVGFNLDVGAAMRFHHSRPIENPIGAKKITPEMLAGAGIQVELNSRVQLFTDLNIRYYNHISNAWTWIMESGAGIRVAIN